MDLSSVIQAAMQLGVIPALALFLVVKLHAQNKRLTDMIERREEVMLDWIGEVVMTMVEEKRGRNAASKET